MARLLPLLLLLAVPSSAGQLLFEAEFKKAPGDGWRWIREDPQGWRATPQGLELRVLPGNMWGPPNNAKNVLVRRLPESGSNQIEISVKVENHPTEQYEQVDLVWYYDDSNMVKIGLELVDKKLCVVMGREEMDRTRTIAIVPKATPIMRLRLVALGKTIHGYYQRDGATAWEKAGECSLPVNGVPNVSLQAYQGPSKQVRWARITNLRVTKSAEKTPAKD